MVLVQTGGQCSAIPQVGAADSGEVMVELYGDMTGVEFAISNAANCVTLAARPNASKRTWIFLEPTIGPHVNATKEAPKDIWRECALESCGKWRVVPDSLYQQCIHASGQYTCIGGCDTPLTGQEAAAQA